MGSERIYVDFLNADGIGRLILSCRGTVQDLETFGIELKEGLVLTLYSDDADNDGNLDNLIVPGVVEFDSHWGWVARIDWDAIKHESDLRKQDVGF